MNSNKQILKTPSSLSLVYSCDCIPFCFIRIPIMAMKTACGNVLRREQKTRFCFVLKVT